MGLTTKEIENAIIDNKSYKLADGGGLCLLILPTRAKLWRYRFEGKENMMALGEYPLSSPFPPRKNAICRQRYASSIGYLQFLLITSRSVATHQPLLALV